MVIDAFLLRFKKIHKLLHFQTTILMARIYIYINDIFCQLKIYF